MIYKRDGHTAHTCREMHMGFSLNPMHMGFSLNPTCREMHILHRRGSEECRRYIYKRDARTHFKEIYKN